MIDAIVEVLAGILPVDIPRRNRSAYKAYRAAWKQRESLTSGSIEPLVLALKTHSVDGAYGPQDSEEVGYLFDAWRNGTSPTELKKQHKHRQ